MIKSTTQLWVAIKTTIQNRISSSLQTLSMVDLRWYLYETTVVVVTVMAVAIGLLTLALVCSMLFLAMV